MSATLGSLPTPKSQGDGRRETGDGWTQTPSSCAGRRPRRPWRRRRSAPNPWVGCVIARDGEVVGEGATDVARWPARRGRGPSARGRPQPGVPPPTPRWNRARITVGRRPVPTPYSAAGVGRVVIALVDPDPRVAGTGINRLREQGVIVEVGVGADDARRSSGAVPPAPHIRPIVRGGEDGAEHRRSHRRPAMDRRAGSPDRTPEPTCTNCAPTRRR